MDESSAPVGQEDATPIFGSYRRGYDPEQVDRFVADQRNRLDEALHRASEAERRLAAAVGQLRELHRRVTLLESDERTSSAQPQPPSLDTLGERVQRILQEAWEGAYAVRQTVEQEVAEMKERATASAEEIVAASKRKSEAIEEEIERRRHGYLERVDRDRARAIAQMTYLSDQRKLALEELLKVKARIEEVVSEVAKTSARTDLPPRVNITDEASESVLDNLAATNVEEEQVMEESPEVDEDGLEPTMPVHRLRLSESSSQSPDTSLLVSSHRSTLMPSPSESRRASSRTGLQSDDRARAAVFDFDEAQPS